MPYETKPGHGSLFKNRDKQQEKHADYRGEINIEGTLYTLGAWIKEGKNGKYMSLFAAKK